ncbi:class I SAM-dependent methyltransferase [Pseudonocardia sp. C8]|nr:class I SAM-dependent methyltransferase [Pseudonocardia sp. C8]
MPVHPSNLDQLRAWDGDEGGYWAAHPDHFERALAAYDDALFDAAAIGSGDRVLDIGCGTGSTSRHAARLAATGSVLGVDLSSAMVDVARRRAAATGHANVVFAQADAQVHPFEAGAFDVAVGRTSAMFFGDRVAALANIGRALRPGGRLALLTWQPVERNEWIREFGGALAAGRTPPAPPPDAPGPFSLADPGVIRAVLDSAGYTDVRIDGHEAPMWFGTDPDDAHELVLGLLGWMLDGLDDAAASRARDALRATITAHRTPGGVVFRSAAWIIRATRSSTTA